MARRPWQLIASNRRGTTSIEFALTAPILFLLVMASIEFSRANVLINTAKVAASEGARRGIIIGTTASEIESVIRNELSMVGVAHADVRVNPSIVTDNTLLVTVGVGIPLDHRNGYVIPKFFVGDHVFKVTAIPREAKKHPNMNKMLADSFTAMQQELQEAAKASVNETESL